VRSECVLGIDQGTSGLKVGLFDAEGDPLAVIGEPYESQYPRPGWVEQDPRDWWRALEKAVPRALEMAGVSAGQVVGLSVAATAATVIAANRAGEVLAPAIMWADVRSHEEAAEASALDHPVRRFTGGQVSEEWMIPKVMWLKRHRPELYRSTEVLMEALDWLTFRLTGEWTASLCQTTNSWYYVPSLGGWLPEACDALGIPEVLQKWPSRVLPVGAVVGGLSKAAAAALDLTPGIPVAEGGIDSHIGTLGLGVATPGRLAFITGSSNVFLAYTAEPAFHPGLWGPYQDAVVQGLWLSEGGQTSTGSILRWLGEMVVGEDREGGFSSFYERMNAQAEQLPPGSEGLVALDFWQGNRTPWRNAKLKGTVCGLTLRHGLAHLYRAVMEGVAFGSRAIIDAFREAGADPREIRMCGGATRSRLWTQIYVDVCGVPISIPRVSEATVLGAAAVAAAGAGLHRTLGEAAQAMTKVAYTLEPGPNAGVYQEYYQKYLALNAAVKDVAMSLG
jgi:FGGY-family pentulose kinase